MNLSKIKISLLIFDFEVYPRHKISGYHVNELCNVLESGKELDPIVWDKETKIIIDGFHRVKAHKKAYGLDCKIQGYAIECKDKAEMILKGIEYNSKHGLRLSAWDQARCMTLARMYKIRDEIIKKALGIPEERYKKLEKRIVNVKNKSGKIIRKAQLKRGQEKLAEKGYITEKEAEAIEGNGTTGLKADIRIRTLIKDIDMNNFEVTKKNVEMIKELIGLLEEEVANYEK